MNLIIFGALFLLLGLGMIVSGILRPIEDTCAIQAAVQAKATDENNVIKEPPPGFCIVSDGKKFRAMRTGVAKIIIKDGDEDGGYDKPSGALKRAWRQYEYELRPKKPEDDYGTKFTAEQERLKAAFKPVPELCKELSPSP